MGVGVGLGIGLATAGVTLALGVADALGAEPDVDESAEALGGFGDVLADGFGEALVDGVGDVLVPGLAKHWPTGQKRLLLVWDGSWLPGPEWSLSPWPE